jgi:hypothetical protein
MDWLGRKVGNLYALSSIGSIVGTILTAFYLITLIGVRKIIIGEGILSILMAFSVLGFHLFFKDSHGSKLK